MSTVDSWFGPSAGAVAEPLAKARPRRRTAASAKPRAQRRPMRSFRVRASLLWMSVFAVLLVGVVALNVAVLQANVSVNDLDKRITQLQQENANLAGEYAGLTAPPRVSGAATRAGLVQAPSADTSYTDMVRHK